MGWLSFPIYIFAPRARLIVNDRKIIQNLQSATQYAFGVTWRSTGMSSDAEESVLCIASHIFVLGETECNMGDFNTITSCCDS